MKTLPFISGIAVISTAVFFAIASKQDPHSEKAAARPHDRPKKSTFIREAIRPDHSATANRLFAGKEWKLLTDALDSWFEADPGAARDWIASRENLEPLEPAIARIAAGIGRRGDVALALEWAELLPPGPGKIRSLNDIYALAARNQQLTDDQLRSAPLPPDQIERLLSRTADD